MIKSYISVYGGTKIPKGYCKECKGNAFIIDGKLACCDQIFNKDPKTYKNECVGSGLRSRISTRKKRELLKIQDYRCKYCDRKFGSMYSRKGKILYLKIDFDHFIPFSYLKSNPSENWVAACHICNRTKGSKIFDSIGEAYIYIKAQTDKKGYIF